MALFLQHADSSYQWAVWKIDETTEELLCLFPEAVQHKYRSEIERFHSEVRRQERLAVRALLYTILGEVKEIGYEESGKPYLKDSSCYISFTHTKGYAAVIVSAVAAVGIDIEQYGQRIHKIASRFMHEDEVLYPYQQDITWSLLLHWSAKEAVYKCMLHPTPDFRNLVILPFKPTQQGAFQMKACRDVFSQHWDVHYLLHSDFVLTWLLDKSSC